MRTALHLTVIGLLASSAQADTTKSLLDQAAKLYEQADLAGALAKLEQAYEQSKRPDILFGIARIHVDRGNCAKAIEVYRTFLESKPKPGPKSTQIATEKIAECQRILAVQEPPKPAEPDVPPEPAQLPERPEPPKTETRVVHHPWYTDVVGDVLVAGGVVGLAVSGWFYMGARRDIDEANRGGAGGVTASEYIVLRDRAESRQMYAAIAAGVGGLLIVSGVLKYAISDRTEVVPLAPAGDGAVTGVALRGQF